MTHDTAATRSLESRRPTETRKAFRTTEFWAFVVLAVLILIAGQATSGDGGENDPFAAHRVWLYVTILGSAYMISRGLAKTGTAGREAIDRGDGGSEHGLGERFKTAAAVLKDGEEAVQQRPAEPRPGPRV
jgi:hypothetical protein